MNRKLLIPVVIVVILLLGLGGFMLMNKNKSQTQTASPQTSNPSPTKAEDVITSVKDMLTKQVSIKCDFDDKSKHVVAYIKNGAVRADTTGEQVSDNSSMIVKGTKFYVWTQGKGFMMDVPKETMDQAMNEQKGTNGMSPNQMLDSMEQYREKCKPATVSDDVFTPPSDIKFSTVPSVNVPSINPSTYQEMMKKYQTPSR